MRTPKILKILIGLALLSANIFAVEFKDAITQEEKLAIARTQGLVCEVSSGEHAGDLAVMSGVNRPEVQAFVKEVNEARAVEYQKIAADAIAKTNPEAKLTLTENAAAVDKGVELVRRQAAAALVAKYTACN